MANTDKFLILSFQNAKLFRKHKNTKDKSIDLGVRIERKDMLEFVEPITVQQISNMLHVLFGKRPKPMNRYVFYGRNEYLYEKANQSYLLLETFKNDKNQYVKENIQVKKALHNSWNPVSYMNWVRVKKVLGEDYFNQFISVLTDILGYNPLGYKFDDLKNIIKECKDARLEKLFDELTRNGKTSFYNNIFGNGSELSEINKNNQTILTVFKGLDKAENHIGKILVPVSDEDLDVIKNNKGFATLLDGGLVIILGVKHSNIVSTEGYTKVSEISLEQK